MNTQTYEVTPAVFNSYFASLPSQGFSLTPQTATSGTATGHGVVLKYAYDGATLTLTGISKPWIVSWDYVFGLIAEHLSTPPAA